MSIVTEETKTPPGRAAFVVWAVVLWFLSSRSKLPHTGFEFPHFDKVAHFCYFGLGAALLARALRGAGLGLNGRPILAAVAVMAAVGMLDEYHQSFVPGRSGNDLGDWIADVSGSVVALAAWRRWSEWGRKRAEEAAEQ